MKKYAVTVFLISQLAFVSKIYSQNVSINSTGSLPDASAMLDISSTTSGFLLPRMTTAQQNAIGSPATGLLIYNTTTGYFMVNTGTPGSPVWTPLAFNNKEWSILGNSGTVDGTNFLGTTDNVPLNFEVNSQRAGRIDNTNANTFFGYQSGNNNTSGIQNTFIGQMAGYNNLSGYWNTFVGDSSGYSTTTGYRNTSIGYQSLFNNTTGWYNNAFGHKTLYSNTTGSDNMAVGQAALFGNITGTHNIAVGNYTLESTTSGGNNTAVGYGTLYNNNDATGDNTAVGYNAMYTSTSGRSNTAIGTQALTNTTGNYNTAIGNNTGGTNTTGSNNTFIGTGANPSTGAFTNATAIGYNAIVGASNSLVLGGTGANAVNVGISTTTPGQSLEVAPSTGTIRIDGIKSGNSFNSSSTTASSALLYTNNSTGDLYSLPTVNSATLVTSATGVPSWSATPFPPTILVAASRTTAYTGTVAYATLVYNSSSIDVGAAYNTATGVFTAPATGVYEIIVNNEYSVLNALNNGLYGRIIVNGATDMETAAALTPYNTNTIGATISMHDIVQMTSGQTASIQTGNLVNTFTPSVGTGQTILKIIRLY